MDALIQGWERWIIRWREGRIVETKQESELRQLQNQRDIGGVGFKVAFAFAAFPLFVCWYLCFFIQFFLSLATSFCVLLVSYLPSLLQKLAAIFLSSPSYSSLLFLIFCSIHLQELTQHDRSLPALLQRKDSGIDT